MAEGKMDLLREIPRVKLWLVLVLTLVFSVVLLAAAHLTHSLTLRVEAYHALYNLFSLIGCLLTLKLSAGPQSLHNTFGWARMEVLSMLITLLFLTALSFSVSIESVQTAVHAEHQDAMHHPLYVMALGAIGLCLNALVFCLIGGYTHHQGCFLERRDSGSVWVGQQVTQEAVQAGRRMLSSSDALSGADTPHRARRLIREVLRDTCGLVLMEVCAALVHWDDGGTLALYIDPALAVTSATLLVWLSHPYGKEVTHILMQTIPGHIDVEDFQNRVVKEFPAVVSVHHLHIWTFTPTKVVATAHVVFASARAYLDTKAALRQFFLDEGITQVTLQPECLTAQPGCSLDPSECLLRCQQEQCHERECCVSCSPHPLLSSVTTKAQQQGPGGGGGGRCGSRDSPSKSTIGGGEQQEEEEEEEEEEEAPSKPVVADAEQDFGGSKKSLDRAAATPGEPKSMGTQEEGEPEGAAVEAARDADEGSTEGSLVSAPSSPGHPQEHPTTSSSASRGAAKQTPSSEPTESTLLLEV